MGSKVSSVPLLVYLILIVLTAAPVIYIATGPHYYFLTYLVPLLILEILAVLRLFHAAHRSISYFFEAIENDETSLRFPLEVKNKSLKKIHENLNRVNQMIQQIKSKQFAAENFYLNLAQHSATGLIALDPKNNVIVMNQKAYAYAGLSSYLPREMLREKNEPLFRLITGLCGGQTILEKFKAGDSIVFLSVRAAEVKMEDGVYKLISLQDIRQELDEKELDSWIKLIRILSHEIMNSIAPITSLSNTLKKFYRKDDGIIRAENISEQILTTTAEGLEIIEERGKGMLDFVNNFRKLTQVPAPKINIVDIRDWARSLIVLLKDKIANSNIALEIEYQQNLPTLMIDENQMTQVMINILNNAVDVLMTRPENRKIKISFSRNEASRPEIRVSNNGSQVPEEIVEKIFIPFFTTKESGSGIGLSLSRQIVRLHRGTIRVESDADLTSFVITL